MAAGDIPDPKTGCPRAGPVTLDLPPSLGSVAVVFDAAHVEALIRWAQAKGPDYSYAAFCEKVKAAGCAGYLVSFLGCRVVYYGRTAEGHVELLPR